MSNKIIDATLRFVDKFTAPMSNAIKTMERSSKQAQRMGKDIQRAGKGISNAGASLTKGITMPVAAAGIAAFKLASDMQESINKVDVAFGKNAKNVKDWSKNTLEKYGMAQGTALDMAATFGDMGSGMGMSTAESAKMAKSLTGLAGDLASYKNVSVDVAQTALKGIFTGEGESLKNMGYIMNDTTLQAYAMEKGFLKSTVSKAKMQEMATKTKIAEQNLANVIKKSGANSLQAQKAQLSLNKALENQGKAAKGSYKDLSQEEKVKLRYAYVTEKAKNAQGDFGRTGEGAAGQQRQFTEGLKQLGATIGTKLLPVGTRIIKWANDMIKKFAGMSDKQQNFAIKVAGIAAVIGPVLFAVGKFTMGIGKVIGGVGKMAGAIHKAGGIVKIFGAAIGFLTSPLGIAIVAITAIGVAAFLIIKNWTKVKAFLINLGNNIRKIFQRAGGDTSKFSRTFAQAKEFISTSVASLKVIFAKIITFARPIVTFFVKVFIARIKVTFSMLTGALSGVISSVMDWASGFMQAIGGVIDFVEGVFTGNWSKAWDGVKNIFGGAFKSMVSLAKMPLNAVIGLINGAISGINKLGVKIPKWVPGLGGKAFSINIPRIPMLAKGTNNWQGGTAITQEKGGEIMDLPRGTRVYPHDKSIAMARAEGASSGGKSIVLNISKLADKIEVRSDKDIDLLVKKLADELWKRDMNTGEVLA